MKKQNTKNNWHTELAPVLADALDRFKKLGPVILFRQKLLNFTREVTRSPARLSILCFVMLICTGTIVLMLPISSSGKPIHFIDALFTATSASCVTGLAVVDTSQAFSVFGQLTILTLIQVGGLGIMTLSTLFLFMVGKRAGMTEKMVIQDTLTNTGEKSAFSVVKEVFLFVLIFEGLGTFLLFLRFVSDFGVVKAFYCAFFHSISAFCNAGFSLFPDSLMRYRDDWAVNLIICILIIAGGIGFVVISEIRQKLFSKQLTWTKLSMHAKLAILTTGILLISGTILILAMEWNDTLKDLSLPHRIMASFFQSVTARTAGFNTLSIGSMANETLFFTIILMFIGACPGSCAGGVKTTTFAAMVLLGISRLRGEQKPAFFNRTIPEATTGKAISVLLTSMFVISLAIMGLLISEIGSVPHTRTAGKFLELFFEVVSAFGTVGLSTGVTPTLSYFGKLLITTVMFIGRLGPLVIALAISRAKISRIYYAEENIMIG